MTSSGPDGRLPATRSRVGRLGRQIWWTSVPIWSIGFLSPLPFLFYAAGQRTRRAWGWFAGYLAATVAMIVALGAFPSNSGANAAVGGFIVALAGCAAVHSFFLFRPGGESVPAGPVPGAMSVRQLNQTAVVQAKDRIERRKEARHLVATDPALARDLMIGRPDLQRAYDDGGLVDVNHVPGAVLASGLGLTPAEVTDVLAARDRLGRFTSPDELCAYTQLTPDRIDELRDLMIFT